jgi:hypothetical protein
MFCQILRCDKKCNYQIHPLTNHFVLLIYSRWRIIWLLGMELLSLPLVRAGKAFHIFAWWSLVIVGAISAQQRYWSTHYWYFNPILVIFYRCLDHTCIASLHRQILWVINIEKILYTCASSRKEKRCLQSFHGITLIIVLRRATLVGRHQIRLAEHKICTWNQ